MTSGEEEHDSDSTGSSKWTNGGGSRWTDSGFDTRQPKRTRTGDTRKCVAVKLVGPAMPLFNKNVHIHLFFFSSHSSVFQQTAISGKCDKFMFIDLNSFSN